MYTYTVRPMAKKVFHPYVPGKVAFDVVSAGANVTVRIVDKVVMQFPRVATEAAGHRLAQKYINQQKALLHSRGK